MKAFGPRFVGLTGSDAQIKAVEKEYRVYAAKQPLDNGNYGMDHSSVMYLMGPNGKLVSFYDEAISPRLARIWRKDLKTQQASRARSAAADSVLRAGRDQRVVHQADDRHGADAARHRRDRAGDLFRRVVIHIADQLGLCRRRHRRG